MGRNGFVEFLVRAKRATYAGKGAESASAGKQSTNCIFTAAEWNDFADRNAEIR